MANILNSRFSQFYFKFPLNWFYPDIKTKYESFFTNKNTTIIYKDVERYMSFCVQSISWPAVSAEIVEQTFQSFSRSYKSGFDAMRAFAREFDITFKLTEGFLSYFIMQDQFIRYWDMSAKEPDVFLPDLSLRVLNHDGYQVMSMYFRDVVFSGLSDLQLSFASNVPEFQTFTCNFKYKALEFVKDYA